MTAYCKLALGFDNPGGLQLLSDIDPSYFQRYAKKDVLTEWHDYGSRERGGDGRFEKIGRAWFVWVLQAMYASELALLDLTYYKGAQDVPVTVITYNKRANTYLPYNARMAYPDFDERAWLPGGYWANVRIVFTDAIPRSAFNSAFDLLAFGV